jgi:geranylgeranyl pyrophosphate synthase
MAGEGRSGDAEFEERLAEAGARIDPLLEELLPRGRDDFLSDAIWHHLDTGGKRIRPAICLLTCEQFGGDPDRAVPFAAAVEMLHNMLLVHDDLEDGDTVRRDRETVWVRFGAANAVNVGDYLLGVAYGAVLRSPVDSDTMVRLLRAFTDAYVTTCRGQALDLNRRARPDLSVADYLEMVTLKTGRYLALGMVGGGIVAGLGDGELAPLERLAESMGAAFQIRDDVIDLTAGKGRGGVTGNDIREGKPSILYAHALSAASDQDRQRLVGIMAKPRGETGEEGVAWVRGLYDRLGSLVFARAEADRLVERAFRTIEQMPPAAGRGFFRRLTRYMVSRNR